MTDEFLRTRLNFKANLPSLYMTPTINMFDHYVAYASKKLEQLLFWQNKRIRFFQFQFNFLKSTQHDLNTNFNNTTTAPFVKKPHTQTYLVFLTFPQEFIFHIHKVTSPCSYHSHYSLNPLYTHYDTYPRKQVPRSCDLH